MNERTVEQIYDDAFKILKAIFGKKSEAELVKLFDKALVKKGKLPPNYIGILDGLVKANKEKKKMKTHEIESVRKNAVVLINHLIEYNQRCDLVEIDKGRMRLKFKDNKVADLIVLSDVSFLIADTLIFKINERKMVDSSQQEFEEFFEKSRGKEMSFDNKVFEIIKKQFGEFEVIL